MSETYVDPTWQSVGFLCVFLVCLCVSSFLRYTKMKTATNIYIFNLALADSLALATLPFQVNQMINKFNYHPWTKVIANFAYTCEFANFKIQ